MFYSMDQSISFLAEPGTVSKHFLKKNYMYKNTSIGITYIIILSSYGPSRNFLVKP